MAKTPTRAHFGLSYSEVMELPVKLRDEMIERLNRWWKKETPTQSGEAK